MAVVVGQIQINLGANTAAFQVEMDRAAALAAKSTGQISGTLAKLSSGSFKSVVDGAKGASGALGEMGSHGVTNVQALSGSLRALEGNMTNNLRAAERFAASIPGLGELAQKVFPIAGGLALGGVLSELIGKAGGLVETFKKIEQTPARISEQFRGLNNSLQTTNDQTAAENDKLRDQIAKLEGRPSNGLAYALDEARIAADHLSESLTSDLDKIKKIFDEESISAFKGFFTGQGDTQDLERTLFGKDGYSGFRGHIEEVTDKYREMLAAAKPEDTKGIANIRQQEQNELLSLYGNMISAVNEQLARRNQLQSQYQSQQASATRGAEGLFGVPANNSGEGLGHLYDQSAAIHTLEGVRRNLEHEKLFIKIDADATPLKARIEQLRTQPKESGGSDADPVAKKLVELRAQLAETRALFAAIDSSPLEKAFTKGLAEAQKEIAQINATLAPKGGSVGPEQSFTIAQLQVAINLQQEMTKLTEQQHAAMTRLYDEQAAAEAKLNQESQTRLFNQRQELDETYRLISAQTGGQAAIRAAEAANIQSRVAAAQISQDEADMLIEQLNAKARLADIEAALSASADKQLATLQQQHAILVQIGADKALINANEEKQQQLIDKNTLATGNFRDGVRLAFKDMSDNAQSSAQASYNFINSAFTDINSTISKLIEGQKTSWDKFFQGLASSMAKIGLEKFEGSIGGKLGGIFGTDSKGGFDPTKPTGTVGNPLYVKMLSSDGSVLGGLGLSTNSKSKISDWNTSTSDGTSDDSSDDDTGDSSNIFGSIFGKLGGLLKFIHLPGFAEGGSIGGGAAAIVGEAGPELFIPRTSGTIIPNKSLSGGGGATYYIDARGADEAAIDKRVRAALVQVHGSAIKTSAAVQADLARRKP